MNGLRTRLARDAQGRFTNDDVRRVNVEDLPRLAATVAGWVVTDCRRHPYLLLWTLPDDPSSIAWAMRMEAAEGGGAVLVEDPGGTKGRIELIRRPLPRHRSSATLFRCPGCKAPRRFLYPLTRGASKLVPPPNLGCPRCAGFYWTSQGASRSWAREILKVVILGDVEGPWPREGWNPVVVTTDPARFADVFPGLFANLDVLQHPAALGRTTTTRPGSAVLRGTTMR